MKQYMVLDYTRKTIIRWLTEGEVLVVCKTMMALPDPSFDVVCNSKFVTCDFAKRKNSDDWFFDPQPQAESLI